jgi:predicted alpha/beta hydrolase family esterase
MSDKAILVGLSFGGLLASVLAAHHPERVKAAILVGTITSIGPPHYRDLTLISKPSATVRRLGQVQPRLLAGGLSRLRRTLHPQHLHSEPHSTKQIEDGIGWAVETNGPVLVKTVEARARSAAFDVSEAMYRKIRCPVLIIHGDNDQIQPYARAQAVAEVTGAEFVTIAGGGHNPLGRIPAKTNTLIVDFLDRRLGIAGPCKAIEPDDRESQARLYLSSPIGLGHGRRDIAIARELRKLHPDLEVDWLAQDPVTRLLEASGERVHPLSARLASETRHIELESGEHDLHCFQAIRRMDEVLIANFMIFQDAVDKAATIS